MSRESRMRDPVNIAIDPLIGQFLTHLEAVRHFSAHTLRAYRIDLETFFNFLRKKSLAEDPFSWGMVKKIEVRAFLAHLAENGMSKKSIVRRLSAIRSFFSFLHKHSLISDNPLSEVARPKVEKHLPSFLSYVQVEHLFSQPDTALYLGLRDRAAMELFYSSALRLSELVGLNREHIDLVNRRVLVRGKGKKERIVPITHTAVHWITLYLNDPRRLQDVELHQAQKDVEAVFLNRWGSRVTGRSIDRHFAAYLRSSGMVGRITPHVIRHTIATHWLERGMDLKTIQTLLGHKTLVATTIYTQVSSSLKRKAYEQAHPLAKETKLENNPVRHGFETASYFDSNQENRSR